MPRDIIFANTYIACGEIYLYVYEELSWRGVDRASRCPQWSWSFPFGGSHSDIEAYLQETGRAGRDGESSNAILYYSNADFAIYTEDCGMKAYCKNDHECRRRLLLQDFDQQEGIPPTGSSMCCDICAPRCIQAWLYIHNTTCMCIKAVDLKFNNISSNL